MQLTVIQLMQEVAHWSLDLLWKERWWREYECSRDAGKHRSEHDVVYFTVILLRRSSFSSIGPFALKIYPNTVMGQNFYRQPHLMALISLHSHFVLASAL